MAARISLRFLSFLQISGLLATKKLILKMCTVVSIGKVSYFLISPAVPWAFCPLATNPHWSVVFGVEPHVSPLLQYPHCNSLE